VSVSVPAELEAESWEVWDEGRRDVGIGGVTMAIARGWQLRRNVREFASDN
jgi:hypothetical protein